MIAAAWQHVSDGVLHAAPDGTVTFVNPAALRILRAEGGLVGQRLSAIFDQLNTFILEAVDAAQDEQRLSAVELYIQATDEWVPVNLTVLPGAEGTVLVLEDLQREQELRRAMARYVSDGVIDGLLGGAASNGAIQPATILFSDIRGFSRLSETIGPTETVTMLNEYFSYMEDVVANRAGTIDKYIGDAVMAVFGMPRPGELDAENAVQAAADMLQVLAMLNASRARAQQPVLRIGIGLATGPVLVGNIGSPKRMDFTAIGEPVNLAARLESATKLYGADILFCGRTAAALPPGRGVRVVDLVRMAGQDQPTEVHELLDHRTAEWGAGFAAAQAAYAEGLAGMKAGAWAAALPHFEAALHANPRDRAAALLAQRCRDSRHSPPDRWDGAFTLTEK
jgi:adenylate cyclase